jgi:NAD(P)-dependent dehydrogenase (short-subunit alcohol dehydrogenase family)
MQPHFDSETVPDYAARTRLDGRVVAVVGAGRGIGRQTAHAMAQFGARVACVDREAALADRVASETGGHGFAADVRREAGVEALFDAIAATMGVPSAVVDIVGGSEGRPLAGVDDAHLQRTFELNLFQAIHVTRVAGQAMARAGGGAVVLIGSVAGFASLPNQIAYGAAKAALHHFIRGAAAELGHAGVRVNGIAPGYVRTERMVARFDAAQWDEIAANTPLQRAGATADIAGLAVALVQDLAGFVTGQVVQADGGLLGPPRVMRLASQRQIAGSAVNG